MQSLEPAAPDDIAEVRRRFEDFEGTRREIEGWRCAYLDEGDLKVGVEASIALAMVEQDMNAIFPVLPRKGYCAISDGMDGRAPVVGDQLEEGFEQVEEGALALLVDRVTLPGPGRALGRGSMPLRSRARGSSEGAARGSDSPPSHEPG